MAEEPRLLRVGVDARLVSGDRGGVEQVIIGLAHGLSQLDDGDERYLFLVDEGHTAWLEPYISGPCSLLMSATRPPAPDRGNGPAATSAPAMAHRLARAVLPSRIRKVLKGRTSPVYSLPHSDGAIEAAGVEVMHFPMQVGFETGVPTIFTPHDLQHLHLPGFFTPSQIAEREASYRDLCTRASLVVVMSSWGKEDIVERYGLPRDKVRVVPASTTLEAYRAPTESQAAATALVALCAA